MVNIIVVVILFLLIGNAIRVMIKSKKNGISLQCGIKCSDCSGCNRER